MRTALFLILCFISSCANADETPSQGLYDINVKSIDGQSIPLSGFRGRVLLIVNTAGKDRNSIQMSGLEELYQKYRESGFIILAFPSDDFMNEESGSSREVRAIYQEKYGVTFPILEKVNVTGPDKSPLYAFLTSTRTNPTFGWEVDWSFTKFLVDRRGNVVNRFSTTTQPTDPKVIDAIDKAMAEK